MEHLISHGAHFLFPTSTSRDSIAPILASWLQNLSPLNVPALIHSLFDATNLIK
uniref:Uncharacterized protein n=1 Tax=Globisporangium ultimum (strain ATCC 200006 / CBS 805.95 / DAOM BR144) TaxID=431595 RepID=K3WR33_GLOUD